MDFKTRAAIFVMRIISKELNKRNESKPSNYTPPSIKKETPKEATWENAFAGGGCLLGILIAIFAAIGGVNILWCLATPFLTTYFLMFIGKIIDKLLIKLGKKSK
ncbi:hypothetical protein FJR11_20965 [Anabaena sp. UHCC 0187]|uniref:hypothetical protein n=1 Tax=Anabaena sp. UHCC 0187 TaxID=2590018 RepID=UPI0014484709|nr:hypothetical protein [Anabaena sp. UHCC 0187]MTJ15001.1 hypothetical protein [Anabaena sp. UHCC 0187]